jgi:predicted nucleotidyltransferase
MSTLNDIILKLKELKPAIIDKYKLSRIGVFGSYVRNEQSPASDVDILVEFSEPIGLDFVTLADELETALNEKVDLISRKAIKPNKWKNIEKDLIYV